MKLHIKAYVVISWFDGRKFEHAFQDRDEAEAWMLHQRKRGGDRPPELEEGFLSVDAERAWIR